jgi:hypothetical protein
MEDNEAEPKDSSVTSDDLANELEADLEKELAETSEQEVNGKYVTSLRSGALKIVQIAQ